MILIVFVTFLLSSACKRRVDHNTGVCVNPTCTSSDPLQLQANNMQTTFQEFDFRVDLSDHTGGIGNFRLQGDVAEKVLGCTVSTLFVLSLLQEHAYKTCSTFVSDRRITDVML